MILQEIVDFIIANRKDDGKAFHNWTEHQIAKSIYEAYEEETLLISISEIHGGINGVVQWQVYPKDKILYINNLLTDGSKGVIRSFLGVMDTLYPLYKLEGQRFGKIKTYHNMTDFKCHATNLT